MTTEKQLIANRANAMKSTGPKTIKGKDISRQNAMQHGLTARGLLLPGESPSEYEAFEKILLEQLSPVGALEESYANEIVSLIWRIKRVPMFESLLIEKKNHSNYYQDETKKYLKERKLYLQEQGQSSSATEILPPLEEDPQYKKLQNLSIGSVIEGLLQYDALGKIVRYETSLDNRLARAVKKFKELQTERLSATTVDASPEVTPKK